MTNGGQTRCQQGVKRFCKSIKTVFHIIFANKKRTAYNSHPLMINNNFYQNLRKIT